MDRGNVEVSRKYTVKKSSTSNYPERLKARGLGKAPLMPSLEELRRKQLEKGQLRKEYITFQTQLNQKPYKSSRDDPIVLKRPK